jgi:cellulose synthase/poly-beta-1,6-N-acetylglucosamine synthase-like glycosyltransferase
MLYRLDTIRVVPPREYIKAACHLIISFRLHSSNFLFRYLWTFRRLEMHFGAPNYLIVLLQATR